MPARIGHRNLPQLLLKARECMLSHFRPILNHCGVTEQQWRIIRALSEHGALEPRQICEICQILSPSMAGVLSRMEEAGLIVRERMAEDQRRVQVRLTERSHDIIEYIAPLIDAQYQALENAVGKPLLDEVYRVLDRLIESEARAKPTPVRLDPVPYRSPATSR